MRLSHKNYDPAKSLITPPLASYKSGLTDYELITLYNRIPASTKPILFPNNMNLITPLIHPDWVSFMLGIPKEYRKNSFLFKKIILNKNYDLDIPCKNNLGLKLYNNNRIAHLLAKAKIKSRLELSRLLRNYHVPPLGINYLYYPEAIRQNLSLKNAVEEACVSLSNRNVVPWLSPKKIFSDHLKRKSDYSEALLILLGLEVNLRAEI
ncbi:hypothetical protein [Gillisia limnaea]|uniref:Uncharacterized protein n=3 Tax=Gillisia TaxID=244698 RepID=H2BRT2_GILLR|nr:hypothetical protein [Gillisia limnaea]EHQ01397.1 hypothetical protein Gilli_0686 [Gillisia limnaea DSM 15749]